MADSLKNALVMIRNNFSTGLYAHCLLRRLTPERVATGDRVIVGEEGLYCIPHGKEIPSEAGDYYEVGFAGSPSFDLERATMEFAKMLLRNLTLDSFEAAKKYCHETGQFDQLHAQPWYQFARMMRNSLTHTQRWHFNRYDRRRLPVTWRDKTIELSMEGKEPDFNFYDWWDGCELWEEICAFAESLE